MKKIINLISVLIIVVVSSAFAADNIMIHDAWVRSGPPNAKVLAAYMKIINKSDEPRALTAVSSSRFGKVEMHKTEMHGEMMKMIPQKKFRKLGYLVQFERFGALRIFTDLSANPFG